MLLRDIMDRVEGKPLQAVIVGHTIDDRTAGKVAELLQRLAPALPALAAPLPALPASAAAEPSE
jgi:hypothetical protein